MTLTAKKPPHPHPPTWAPVLNCPAAIPRCPVSTFYTDADSSERYVLCVPQEACRLSVQKNAIFFM